jgi:molybdate transport system substrate-binding protein
MLLKLYFSTSFIILTISLPAYSETIHCSIAASMSEPFAEIIRHFGKIHPDARVLTNVGSSGTLAKQIEQGAPTDLYLSANESWMDYLVGRNGVAPSTVTSIARNTLVFIAKPESSVAGFTELVNVDLIAMGNPQSVPAGVYAQQAMIQADIYDELLARGKLIFAKDVRHALAYADRGEVDGAFVYKTDALAARSAVLSFVVPGTYHDPIIYPIALTRAGTKKPMALALHDFLRGDQAREILARFGFEPPH